MLEKNKEKKEIRLQDVFTDNFIGDLAYLVTKRVFTALVTFTIVGFILFNFIFSLSVGPSMYPSVPDNSIVIAKQVKSKTKLKKGDIIIFSSPEGDDVYTKRIIGESGDIIDIKNNEVYINNERLEEVYIKGVTFGQSVKFSMDYKVDEDAYYVLGDNRENSMDSRDFGTIKKETIMGKVVIILPVGEIMDNSNIGIHHIVFVLYAIALFMFEQF